MVAVRAADQAQFEALAAKHAVPLLQLGQTSADPALEIEGLFIVPLAELREVWSATPPHHFGRRHLSV